MSLFRLEALEHHQQKSMGEILLTRPLSMYILSWAAFAIALCLIGFTIWGEYTKKQRVMGVLMPDKGLIRIYPSHPGVVVALKVKEGEHVRKGQILYTLTTERIASGGRALQATSRRQLQAQRASLQAEVDRQNLLNKSRHAALRFRLSGLHSEIKSLNQAIVLNTQQINLSKLTVQRYKELADQQFLSAAQLQIRQEEHLNQLIRQKNLEREYSNIQRDIAIATEELASSQLKGENETAAITRQIHEVEKLLLEIDAKTELQVVAPDNGIVSAILAKPGQMVTNTPLLTLLPMGACLTAELYAPSRAVGFIKPGSKVLLRYQSYPYEKFGQPEGTIASVSQAPIAASELNYLIPHAADGNIAYYRIEVILPKQTITAYGKEEQLHAGTEVEADILLDKRKLYEWLFEPLYSITSKT